MYVLSILIILVGSPWTWEIFSFHPSLLLLIVSSAIFLYLSIVKLLKKFFYIFCFLLIPILIIQWITTKNAGLNYMDVTDQHLFATRRYKLSVITPNLARYLESKPEYMFYKFEQNLLRHMDLNLYFFGSHPRERAGIREFEKFSFLFLPLFLIGLLELIKSFPGHLLISLIIPLLVLSFSGQDNPIGPFVLFPFFSVTLAIGLVSVIKSLCQIVKVKN